MKNPFKKEDVIKAEREAEEAYQKSLKKEKKKEPTEKEADEKPTTETPVVEAEVEQPPVTEAPKQYHYGIQPKPEYRY